MNGPEVGPAPGPAPRRSRRDWAVDIVIFLFAVAFGVTMSVYRSGDPATPGWVLTADQVMGALGCAALWLRRRWPVGLALVLTALSTFSELAAGAMVAALFTVAVHRPLRVAAAVGTLGVLLIPVQVAVRPDLDDPLFAVVLLGVTVNLAVIGWGLFIRSRRQLMLSLRERAARAETEALLRAEQAQHRAREQIAREMHDVLGHRLSLLSVHAGALEYRPDAPAPEIARAAAVIRQSAHQALQDLREVIGVLRAPVGELPQPTLADVHELVAESERAGARVDLRAETAGTVPDGVGRAAYRIVQEGLTNARKHAPGAEVSVTVTGAPGKGLTVQVVNQALDAPPAAGDGAGAGQGLIGLAERAALAGGRLEYGPTAPGGFRLSAWLPWPP
ncbi:MAG: sensor histidine kinase [Streptosporangiales bacterium]|nr:sensor histidine kinase [Streptosporangiales bacterium]